MPADPSAVLRRANSIRKARLQCVRNLNTTDSRGRFGNKRGPCLYAVVANLYYNDRLIIAFTTLNVSDKQWTAGAEITWKKDGQRHSHSIAGLLDRFKSSEDAEKFVVHLAKAWIDANP